MVSGAARSLLGVAGWARGQAAAQAGGPMDFAPEPVLDAITPPPMRQAQRAPAPDENGQSFNDHLDAVSEPVRERPAPAQNQANDESAPVAAEKPAEDIQTPGDEAIDPDVALLGGPLPHAAPPPPMAAPVVVQIAASQPEQQTQPQNTDADAAPAIAPQTPAPVAPENERAMAATAEPVEQSAPVAGKQGQAEVKPSAPTDAQQTPAQPQSAQTTQQQAQQIPAANTATEIETLPQPVRDAIAATIAPAPQALTQTAQHTTRVTQQPVETDAAAPKDGKAEASAPAVNAKAQAPRTAANGVGNLTVDPITAAPQTPSSAPDSAQIAQSNAITTTASQASTHVQHAAIDSGAQRAAPAAAQVGREIIRRFDGGNTSFELRLDPAELGRVEVRMEVTRDHRVTAVITADDPQALTELARNARELEQQLQSAGLQLSDNGLSFDLRQGGHGGDAEQASNGARGAGGEETLAEQQPAPVARPLGYERWRGVRVDMMV